MIATSRLSSPPRAPTRRDPLARYRPRAFTQNSRWRFCHNRRTIYLARLGDAAPTDHQAALIESLVELEWSTLAAEAQGGITAFREGRELRRLFLRALADFERTITAATAVPEDPLAALHRHLAERREAVG